jgi:uncharacterized membrane protein
MTSPPATPDPAEPTGLHRVWINARGRILGGLFLVLPLVISLWVFYWLYSTLEKYVIDPLVLLVMRKVGAVRPDAELPVWFETYAAPLIAIVIALALLYLLGFLVRSRLRSVLDALLLRVPIFSLVYNGVGRVFRVLEKQQGQKGTQRVVLIPFPHPGLRAAAFVTATCRDLQTGKTLLCVCVPTSPVPTVGYLLVVPEDEVTELNWTAEQTLQTILSAGLTAPEEIRYFPAKPAGTGELP